MGFDFGAGLEKSATAPWKARNFKDFLERSAQGSIASQLLVQPQVDAQRLQKANLKKQDLMQRQSLAEAASQRRTDDMAKRKVNQKSPNVAALLSAAQAAGAAGSSSTLLSGLGGGLSGGQTTLGGRS